ncbi:MAG: PEP-CTERM sorting domain-containing protein, partial [Microcystaceae cyanobacterium]
LDVKNESFEIIHDLTGFTNLGTSLIWTLSDLDWVDTPGIVTGVTLTGGNGNPSLITDTSFTDDSITINISPYNTPPEPTISTWTFDIQTEHTPPVPEPSTILGLLTFAGLGLGSRLKQRK